MGGSLFISFSVKAEIFYVNQITEGGANNGKDWSNAFISLKVALFEAQYGDTIWVAKGVYFPSSNLRNDAFFIKNGIALFGGFNGTETTIEQRDIKLNITVLSGERGDTSILNDNHFHVVSMTNADSTTILDGFIITSGYAFDEEANFNHHSLRGGGLFIENNRDNFNTNPIIRNCSFYNNTGRIGGAIFIKSEDENNQYNSPTIENCFFHKNTALWTGGAIYKEGGSDKFKILNTSFLENKVNAKHGGAIHFLNSYGKNIIDDCLFEKDSTRTGEGGAIFYETRRRDSELRISNSVFKDNFSRSNGGAIELISLEVSLVKSYHNFRFDSCVFDNNYSFVGTGGALAISNVNSQFNVEVNNCNFQNNYAQNGGGSIYSMISSDSIFLKVTNSIFSKNTSLSGIDGNIYLRTDASPNISYQNFQLLNSLLTNNSGVFSVFSGNYEGKIETSVTNCTSYKNGIVPISKNWSADFDGITRYNDMKIVNSIFYEEPNIFNNNNPSMEEIFFNNNLDSLHLADYQFQNCWINAMPITNCDTTCGKDLIFGENPLFENSTDGDFSLRPCSPAVDAGNNMLLPDNFPVDILGNPRIKNSIVDMGAYENDSYQPISIETEQINATSASSSDGQIAIKNISGESPPYQYMWSNGDTSTAIQNLSPEKYSLTITDSNGCSEEFEFEISFTSSIYANHHTFSSTIFPNPIFNNFTTIEINSNKKENLAITIYDTMGKFINYQALKIEIGKNNYALQTPQSKGFYWLTIIDSDNNLLGHHKIQVL